MESSSSYFRVVTRDGKTYLEVRPASMSDSMLSIDEIIRYLKENAIDDYSIKELKDFVAGAAGCSEFLLLGHEVKPIDERLIVQISYDKMAAYGRFYAPSDKGKNLQKEDIIDCLNKNGVKMGIIEENIDEYLQKKLYCRDILLAKGREVEEGKDSEVTFLFDTDYSIRPREREDGTVDYHELGLLKSIKAGDTIAVASEAVEGINGFNVLGQEVKAKKVKKANFKYGKNVSLSPDGLSIISDVNGHIQMVNDKVSVSDVFCVENDVDNSTGNIDFMGNVVIRGVVKSGFRVIASGSIEVEGVVEAAYLEAGKDIILHVGVQGMQRGKLVARENVVARFIESAEVEAGGNVESEVILHSKIICRGEVHVGGKKGFITGGQVRAQKAIVAKSIGSVMGVATVVEVGVDPRIKDRAKEILDSISKISKQVNENSLTIERLNKKKEEGKIDDTKSEVLRSVTRNQILLKSNQKDLMLEYEVIQKELEGDTNSCIVIEDKIYPCVKMYISNDVKIFKDTEHHCRYVKSDGEIKKFLL